VAVSPAASALKKERGTQSDSELLDIFLERLEKGRAKHSKNKDYKVIIVPLLIGEFIRLGMVL
jgi:hypothetical protein